MQCLTGPKPHLHLLAHKLSLSPPTNSKSLFTEIIVISSTCSKNVFIIAATARPEILDPALTRPGRLDRVFVCDRQKTREEERDILPSLASLFDFEEGVDVDAVVLAVIDLLHVTAADIHGLLIDASIVAQRKDSEKLLTAHLEIALSRLRVSLPNEQRIFLEIQLAKYRRGKDSSTTIKSGNN